MPQHGRGQRQECLSKNQNVQVEKNPRVGSARETQGYVSDGTKSEGWSIAEVDDADAGDSKRMRKADVNE